MIVLKIIAFAILGLPTGYEIGDDRHGEDAKDKKKDLYRRIGLMTLVSVLNVVVQHITFRITDGMIYQGFDLQDTFSNLLLMFGKALAMSFAIFFLTFDYLFNIIFHKKTRVWYSYLSKSPLDKLWSGWNWRLRMGIRIAVFIAALLFYF